MVAPYRAAHNITANSYVRYIHQETLDAIANSATATTSDRSAIAQFTSTIARLTADIATMNKKLSIAL